MALDWLIEDAPEHISRGERIMSVLDGSGSCEMLPGRPDVEATQSDWDKKDRYDPEIPFDPNSYSRMDKFDGVEVGQDLIDSELASKPASSGTSAEEK